MNSGFIQILIPLSLGLGIVFGWNFGGFFNTKGLLSFSLIILFLSFCACRLVYARAKNRYTVGELRYRRTFILSFVALLFVLFGFYRGVGERTSYDKSSHLTAQMVKEDKNLTIIGTVVGEPEKWRTGYRFVFRVESSIKDDYAGPARYTGRLDVDRNQQNRGTKEDYPRWEVFLAPARMNTHQSFAENGQAPRIGDRLRIKGVFFKSSLPGVTSWTRNNITGGFFVDHAGSRREPVGENLTYLGKSARVNRLIYYTSRLRRRLINVGEKTLSPESAGLFHGILLGEWIVIHDKTEEGVRKAGVAHLFSVSGMHLIFWLGLFFGVGKIMRLPHLLLVFLSIPVIVVFLLISGLRPSALRAGIMCFLGLVGREFSRATGNRTVKGANLLSAAACLTLVFRPLDLYSIGFWLSYTACAGIFLFFPAWKRALGRVGENKLVQALLLSLIIQIMIAPLLIRYFGGVSLYSPLSNLILVPIAAMALQTGLLAAVVGLFFFPVAQLLNAGNEVILLVLRNLLHFASDLPGYIFLVPWPWVVIVCFYLTLTIITWGLRKNPLNGKRRIPLFYLYLSFLIPVLTLIGWNLISQFDSGLRIVVFDVGQGDSILISGSEGYNVLVDGGTREGFETGVKPYLRSNHITKLDLLVLTHSHEDHLGGVVHLLKEDIVKVSGVMDSGYPHTTQLYQSFLQMIKEKGIKYHRAIRGSTFRIGKKEQLIGVILNPPRQYLSGTKSDLNNNSIVLLLEYKKVRILLTGDIEKEGKEDLLATYHGSLRANIVKVAHHGSKGANHEEWILRTKPEIAVISVGRNNYFGHPSPRVVADLQSIGTRVFRTDTQGEIVLEIKAQGNKRGKVVVKRGNER